MNWNELETGVKGFEPLNVDTKNRCLTAWLYSKWGETNVHKQGVRTGQKCTRCLCSTTKKTKRNTVHI